MLKKQLVYVFFALDLAAVNLNVPLSDDIHALNH